MSVPARLARALRPSLIACVVVLAIPGVLWPAAGPDSQTLSDGQVKAAFLYNFAKFVRWPDAAEGPLVIGIAGNDAFADIFTQTVRGRNVNGRELQAKRLATGDDPAGCQVVFVGAMRSHDEAEWLQRVKGPVLTVGETIQFLRDGGMVRFYVENNNVRFQINQKRAEAAGLKISSQLLMLAVR
jgi:hypothetical protein